MPRGSPRVLLLDGDFDSTLPIARELGRDLDVTTIGAGTTRYSRLLRSKYCDIEAVLPPPAGAEYTDALLDVIDEHRPDAVLPVGYQSTAKLESIRNDLPDYLSHCLPPSDSFRDARDKTSTLAYGERIGIDTPDDYSAVVREFDADGRAQNDLDALPFPLFLKSRYESGRSVTAGVDSPADFWETYDRIAGSAPENDVLVQEYIDGPGVTYGCGVLALGGDIELQFSHEELRSVPRIGGSGTRLRVLRDPAVEASAIRLLDEIGWQGVALVEFKRRSDGSLVLMEINPKFWASYALASTYGYRFASTMVANVLDIELDSPVESPARSGEMVFPLRELNYYLRNRASESLIDCLATIFRPGVARDVDLDDLGAWLTPPVDTLRNVSNVRRLTERAPSIENYRLR